MKWLMKRDWNSDNEIKKKKVRVLSDTLEGRENVEISDLPFHNLIGESNDFAPPVDGGGVHGVC